MPQPWTHETFDADERRFTFAIFSDLTGGERDSVFEIAVAQLNLLRPEFIMSVGDLIESGSAERTGLTAAWTRFDARSQKATAPVFFVGGNHDLEGDIRREIWNERYGPTYYHFLYKDVLFLVMDTEDPSPDGTAGVLGPEQSEYFQTVIADNPTVRWTFVFIHKPAWKVDGGGTFLDIEAALGDRPYTVFFGHRHGYSYEERNGRDYIGLATTGGVQFTQYGRSMDHVTMVTVNDSGVDIVNLLMAGILDKAGRIPLGGDHVCFEAALCSEREQ